MRLTLAFLLGATALATAQDTTFYLTRTVMRVVDTTSSTPSTPSSLPPPYSSPSSAATWSTPASHHPLPSASMVPYNYHNETATVLGTAAGPTMSMPGVHVSKSSSAPVVQATGGAARLGMDVLGFAAVCALIGIVNF